MYTARSLSDFIFKLERLGFPWVRSRYDPKVVSQNFIQIKPIIRHEKYKLSSYFPKKERRSLLFRNQSVIVGSDESTLFSIDILSDIWIEYIRIKSKKGFSQKSPEELLRIAETKLRVFETLIKEHPSEEWTADIVRSTFAFITKEVRPFRLTWIKGILQVVYGNLSVVKGKRWLDISAGWGDRLLAAGLLGMEYLGFDPNLDLIEPHNQMIRFLRTLGSSKIKVEYLPFEDSNDMLQKEEDFDLILSSPPFFDLEIYNDDKNQSLNRYPKFDKWLNEFLFRSLKIAWNHLQHGGYLILYVGDLRNMQITEPMNLFIETLEKSSYEGVIGIENDIGTVRPCWVWKKI